MTVKLRSDFADVHTHTHTHTEGARIKDICIYIHTYNINKRQGFKPFSK